MAKVTRILTTLRNKEAQTASPQVPPASDESMDLGKVEGQEERRRERVDNRINHSIRFGSPSISTA